MIVGFREFEGRFSSRLEFCVGAVLVSPDGVQYECVKRSNYGAQWKIVGGQGEGALVSIARMRELVGDGAGWMVAEVIPDAVFIVVDADNGGLGVGGGQGASRARVFFSRERAEEAVKNMGAWNDTRSYRAIKYKMNAECKVRFMNIKKVVAPIVGLVVAGLLGACTPAEVASSNLSNDSDNFRIMRRIVFVNGITDKYLLSIEGLCSIKKDNQDNQLEVTCKTGDGEYKKHFLGISDNVTYFVEQMEAAQVDTYHYKVMFQPETILPDIDMQTSSSSSQSGS